MTVRNLSSVRIQMDEAWSFEISKQKNVKPANWGKGYGDAWTLSDAKAGRPQRW